MLEKTKREIRNFLTYGVVGAVLLGGACSLYKPEKRGGIPLSGVYWTQQIDELREIFYGACGLEDIDD